MLRIMLILQLFFTTIAAAQDQSEQDLTVKKVPEAPSLESNESSSSDEEDSNEPLPHSESDINSKNLNEDPDENASEETEEYQDQYDWRDLINIENGEDLEPLDDTAEKLDALYFDEQEEGGDWGVGFARGEDLAGLTTQLFIEEGVWVNDLKLNFSKTDAYLGSLSSMFRYVPETYYVESGLSLTLQNLRQRSGTVIQRVLDGGIRFGIGAQFDFSVLSIDIKFFGIDLLREEIYRQSVHEKKQAIETKTYFRESLSVGIIYFP